jgi:hypothetical protein
MASHVLPPQLWSNIVAASNLTTAILPAILTNISALHRHLVQLSLTKTTTPAADIELLRLLSICGVDTANRVAIRPQLAATAAAQPQRPVLAAPANVRKRRWDSQSGSAIASATTATAARCSIPGCKFKGSHPFIIKLSATRHCHSRFPDKVPPSIKRIPMIFSIASRGDALQIATQHAEAKRKKIADETKMEEKPPAMEQPAAEEPADTSSDGSSSPSDSASNFNQGPNEDDQKRRTQVDPVNHSAGDHNSTLNPVLPVPKQPPAFTALPIPSSLAPDTESNLGAPLAPKA